MQMAIMDFYISRESIRELNDVGARFAPPARDGLLGYPFECFGLGMNSYSCATKRKFIKITVKQYLER